jgi:hypothetical protein
MLETTFPRDSQAGLGGHFTEIYSYSAVCSVRKIAFPVMPGYLSFLMNKSHCGKQKVALSSPGCGDDNKSAHFMVPKRRFWTVEKNISDRIFKALFK